MRPADVPRVVVDASKLRARTGWQTTISFEQSLGDVLEYWRDQVRTGGSDPTPPELRIKRDG